MRHFAIIHRRPEIDIRGSLLAKLPLDGSTTVFLPHDFKEEDKAAYESMGAVVCVFDEGLDTEPKRKNFVSRHYKERRQAQGFLYEIEDDSAVVCASYKELSGFLDRLENMMDKLDVNTWLNTSSDQFNYVFQKYNPRFVAHIDDEKYSSLLDQVVFTSHANPMWLCFNLDSITLEQMKFDEDFEIPMFYIVGFLARRRSDKDDRGCNFMNFYPTVPDEPKFINRNSEVKPEQKTPEEQKREAELFQKENQLWAEKKIDHTPDSDIALVMDFLKQRLDDYLMKGETK